LSLSSILAHDFQCLQYKLHAYPQTLLEQNLQHVYSRQPQFLEVSFHHLIDYFFLSYQYYISLNAPIILIRGKSIMNNKALLLLLLFSIIGCSEGFNVDLPFGGSESESTNLEINNAFS